MNTNDGRITELYTKDMKATVADYQAIAERRLEELNREERRKNGTAPWVAVSPKVAAIVKAGHAAMKDKKRRRKIAAASRRANRG